MIPGQGYQGQVYVSADVPPTLTGSTNKVATFKTTPNTKKIYPEKLLTSKIMIIW